MPLVTNDFDIRQDLMTLVNEMDSSSLEKAADIILPRVPVTQRSANYPVFPKENLMKVPKTERAPDGSFPRGTWKLSKDLYSTLERGFEQPADLTESMEMEEFVNCEEVAAKLSVEGLLRSREARISDAIFNETTFAGAANLHTLTNEWDDATNADPITDIDAVWQKARQKNGLAKDKFTLCLSPDLVYYALTSDKVQNKLAYTEPVITMTKERRKSALITALGVKDIIFLDVMYDPKGLDQDGVFSKMWTNEHALFAIIGSSGTGLMQQSLGCQPVWRRYASNYIVDSYDDRKRMKRWFRARDYSGTIIHTDYAMLVNNMKTSVDSVTGI